MSGIVYSLDESIHAVLRGGVVKAVGRENLNDIPFGGLIVYIYSSSS